MARVKKPRYTELYGEYPTLNKIEIEYIKLVSNPAHSNKTNRKISEMLGVDEVSIGRYRKNPIIQRARVEETIMKSADDLPLMVEDLKKAALAKGRYKEISVTDQNRAKVEWFKIHAIYERAKRDEVDKNKVKGKSTVIDEELLELEREFEEDTKKV